MLGAVVLMGVVLILLMLPGDSSNLITDEDVASLGTEDAGNDILVERSTIDLTRLVMNNSSGTFTVSPGSDNTLQIAELAGIPLNTDFLEAVWYYSTTISYSHCITPPADGSISLADFGLDAPQATFTTLYADGTGNEVRIGSEIGSESDTYYFQIDSDPNIYVTELDLAFFLGEKYWISDDLFGTSYEGDAVITKIGINLLQDGDRMVIVPHSSSDKSDPFCGYNYIFTAPEKCAADNYAMSNLVDELLWLTAYEAIVAYPTAADLAAYGLDAPYAILDVVRSGEQHSLRIAKYDYNTLYAMVDDVPVIYQLDTSTNEILAALSMKSLRSSDVHIRYFDAIESFTVSFGGKEYVFRTERIPLNGDSELYEYYSYYGSTPLSLSNFKAMLEVFNHAAASEYTSSSNSSDPYLTIVIRYFDSFGRADETITYTPNGTRRYLCRINGVGSANVTEMWMDKFTASVLTLAAGETVIP